MKPGRMIFLSLEYPPDQPGGMATVAAQKVAGFAGAGWEVELVGPVSQPADLPGVRLTATGTGRAMVRFPIALVKSIAIGLTRRLRLAYAMSGTYPGFIALALHRLAGVPYVVMAHGNEFIRFRNNLLLRALIRSVYANSRAVFAVSSYTAERLREFGVEPSKIRVVYNAVDTVRFRRSSAEESAAERRRYGADDNTVVLLSVSRLDARKNHLKVLRALRKLLDRQPDLEERILYLIAGKGPTGGAIADAVHELGISRVVRQIGFVREEGLALLYSAADVFLLPVVYLPREGSVEGFGVVYLEAAACGLASIAGIAGGTGDAVEHGKTGLLVDGRDVDAIAESILFAVSDPQRWNELAKNAEVRARSRFSFDEVFGNEYRMIEDTRGRHVE